jgi:hypothetical protein
MWLSACLFTNKTVLHTYQKQPFLYSKLRYFVQIIILPNIEKTRMNTGFSVFTRVFELVPVVGVEPTRCRHHGILSPARLPIPSHRHFICAGSDLRPQQHQVYRNPPKKSS